MRKSSRLSDSFSFANPPRADTVGARIRLLRNRRGLTQQTLAGMLGVSRSAVALWETNRGGEVNHLSALAEVLGVPVAFFLTGMVRTGVERTLSNDETMLIDLYRASGPTERLTLLRTAGRLRQQQDEAADPTAGDRPWTRSGGPRS